MNKKPDFDVTMFHINAVFPFEDNPRQITPDAVAKVAKSIKQYGFRQPIVVDDDNVILAGHTRLLASKSLGLEHIPVHKAHGLTEAQKRAYRLADNRSAEESQWDFPKLTEEFKWLSAENFDLGLTTFDPSEIDDFLKFGEDPEEGLTDDDEVPEVSEEPITKEGDIWLLGEHRLMCGDSTNIETVEKLLLNQKANMCFTDPPYLMDFTGGIHADGSKSYNAKHGKIKNDKMSESEGKEFLDAINTNIRMFVDGAFYITFYRLGIGGYYESLGRTGLQCRSLIIWDKGNHTLSNSDYMSMYEPIFYGWVNNHNFYGGNNGMDIWRIKRTAKNDLHPTMKPVELVAKAISEASKKDGIVLDLFAGSGSTIIASQKLNRKCYAMELDPKYCDVSVKRWEDFTGQKAVLETKQ